MNENHTDANMAQLLQRVADEWFSAKDMILGTDDFNWVNFFPWIRTAFDV